MHSSLLHELPIVPKVLRCARRLRGSCSGAGHDDRLRSTSGTGEGASSKTAQTMESSSLGLKKGKRAGAHFGKNAGTPERGNAGTLSAGLPCPGPLRRTSQHFALFSLSRPHFRFFSLSGDLFVSFFSLSLGVFSWNSGEGRDLQMFTFGPRSVV